jgi:CrcB protein
VKHILAIALGGSIGAVLRYLSSTGLHLLMGRAFPYGTLLVNVFIPPSSRAISSIGRLT